MSAQSDKAKFIVTIFNSFGRATSVRCFREFEKKEADAYVEALVKASVPHKLSTLVAR